MEQEMKYILASKSPRRKELMDLLGIKYEVIESNVDEILEKGLTIEEQAKRLGYIKAKAVFEKTKGNRVVIGGDTIVFKDGKIYGKPKNKEDAIKMLKELKNSKHIVITSLEVLVERDGKYKEYIDCDKVDVYIKDMSEKEVLNWIDTGKAYDKAGAYAIQCEFAVFIQKIVGNYFTVVGLPIHKLYDIIKKINE